MAAVTSQRRPVVLALGVALVVLLIGWTSGCSLTGEPPRGRIEAALPNLREQVSRMTTPGPSAGAASELSVDDLLRVSMASCVRYYCSPDGAASSQLGLPDSGPPDDQEARLILIDFFSPQDMPTALPLPGWFGPLRGREEMRQVVRLQVTLTRGRWPDVIAHHADATRSCWRSNWRIQLPPG